ncbi:MAG: AzlD domain-containing protein [Clostridiaceae bacterium]|nr:AzlD domain-containing protein [Clostridiaceae bacterium]
MADGYLLTAIIVMTVVTWLPRMLPLMLVRRRIENIFIRSFLFYVPYAVLAAMTIPAIFFATSSIWSALAGLIVALILGWNRRSLLTVALGASVAVFIIERILALL